MECSFVATMQALCDVCSENGRATECLDRIGHGTGSLRRMILNVKYEDLLLRCRCDELDNQNCAFAESSPKSYFKELRADIESENLFRKRVMPPPTATCQ